MTRKCLTCTNGALKRQQSVNIAPSSVFETRGDLLEHNEMFTTIQFPIADLRCFSESAPPLLKRPSWPYPGEFEYTRMIGPVEKRRNQPVPPCEDESNFCLAHRAIRFEENPVINLGDRRLIIRFLFRRYFSLGVQKRFELGFKDRLNYMTSSQMTEDYVNQYLNLRVSFPRLKAENAKSFLSGAGPELARLLYQATTPAEVLADGGESSLAQLIVVRSPLFYLESGPGQNFIPPVHAVPLDLNQIYPEITPDSLRLFYWKHNSNAHLWHVWFLDRQRGYSWEIARKLRLTLFRLHAEVESLKSVLAQIAQGNLMAVHYDRKARDLKRYLEMVTSRLCRNSQFGLTTTAMREKFLGYEDIDPIGSSDLLNNLQLFRGEVMDQIAEILDEREHQRKMNERDVSITIGDGNYIVGSFNVARTINQTISIANSMNKGDDLKSILDEIIREVTAVVEKLPSDKKEETADDLKRLVEEVNKDQPKRKWYEVSKKGLLEAAEAAGCVIEKLAGPLSKLTKLLFGMG